VDSPGSGWGPLAGCCECGDEPSGSGATELVSSVSSLSPYRKSCAKYHKIAIKCTWAMIRVSAESKATSRCRWP
jgi:hypothetical protein